MSRSAPGGVVIAGAALHPQRLADGDLHVVDMRRVPYRLEQRVGEAQRHQVLHRLLAQVVVDPIDALLGEHLADRVVDGARAGQALADRLFHHHAAVGARQPVLPELLADRAEQVRPGGQVEHPDALRGVRQGLAQFLPAGLAGDVHRHVGQPLEEAVDRRGARSRSLTCSSSARRASSTNPALPRSRRETPTMRHSGGIWPAMSRKNRAGISLRPARSPVAPKMTRSNGSTAMTRATMQALRQERGAGRVAGASDQPAGSRLSGRQPSPCSPSRCPESPAPTAAASPDWPASARPGSAPRARSPYAP